MDLPPALWQTNLVHCWINFSCTEETGGTKSRIGIVQNKLKTSLVLVNLKDYE